jgi:hypothetical protein
MVPRFINDYCFPFRTTYAKLKSRMEMRTELQRMQSFPVDIYEVSALAEERGITRRSSSDQIFNKANKARWKYLPPPH